MKTQTILTKTGRTYHCRMGCNIYANTLRTSGMRWPRWLALQVTLMDPFSHNAKDAVTTASATCSVTHGLIMLSLAGYACRSAVAHYPLCGWRDAWQRPVAREQTESCSVLLQLPGNGNEAMLRGGMAYTRHCEDAPSAFASPASGYNRFMNNPVRDECTLRLQPQAARYRVPIPKHTHARQGRATFRSLLEASRA
jgi:hypothetical protein